MAKYRKKSITVEAVQWMGHDSLDDLDYVLHVGTGPPSQDYAHLFSSTNMSLIGGFCNSCGANYPNHGFVWTLKGIMLVCPGDWIAIGADGEKRPIKPDIFEQTYEKA